MPEPDHQPVRAAAQLESHVLRCLESLTSLPFLTPARIGVDVVDIASFTRYRTVCGSRWLMKLFSEQELEAAHGRIDRLAAGFAGKEAVVKVLHTGFRKVSPRDIEVLRTPRGAPYIVLHGHARNVADQQAVVQVPVSLSRDCGAAIAVALGLVAVRAAPA